MHWNATDGRYHEALRRLAVLLLLLAGIAERAACRAWPLRSLILWLLRRAEARVREFADRAAAPLLYAECCVSPTGGEAALLAQRFRALATVFFALSRRAFRQLWISRRHRRLPRLRRNTPRIGRLIVAGFYADTS
jgi:hypothetical protein